MTGPLTQTLAFPLAFAPDDDAVNDSRGMDPLPQALAALSLAFAPDDKDRGDWEPPDKWYGNIQYLINLSIIGAFCCVLLFFVVKLRSDHRLPGPASLAAKLLAVWHTTSPQLARLCGANASQYLAVEGYSFLGFFAIAFLALVFVLPLNLYGGVAALQDQFSRSTVIHISKGSPLLWGHFLFMLTAVGIVHICIEVIDRNLSSTRFHGEVSSDCIAAFTLMIHGVPRSLAANKRPLQEYFEHCYPGKVYRVVVPPDLASFDYLQRNLVKRRKQLSQLQARIRDQVFTIEDTELFVQYKDSTNGFADLAGVQGRFARLKQGLHLCKVVLKQIWIRLLACLQCTEEDRLSVLQQTCADLEGRLLPYREGKASGAGIAFVIFKDLHTASRALQDVKFQVRRPSPSLIGTELGRSHWKVERAPPAGDIYWHHLGSSTLSRIVRRVTVNACLLLLLFFFSSPLAAFNALHNVGRLLNPDAMDHVQVWLAWVQGSSWAAAVILQFLPNVLIFLSMYFVIPSALAYLSSFESHLTLSGEQRAALAKTVLFFLVNLIFLRGILETSLETTLLHMRHCYEEGTGCKDVEQYMSSSFLANSCLSATAFLITSSFLGISYDLLSPIPWIKRRIQESKRESPVASSPVNYSSHTDENLREQLLPTDGSEIVGASFGLPAAGSSMSMDLEGGDISPRVLVRNATREVQKFDFVQYYAFNLTIFAMALIYSSFVPVIVPISALYFGYRYVVDKYNFLFMYRVRGFPATNDGKLLGTVLRVMKLCTVLYLLAMMYFFYVRGDREKLQFMCTLAMVIIVCVKYGVEKLSYPPNNGFDFSVLESLGSVENFTNGPVDYESFSQPNFDWDNLSEGPVS